MSDCEDGADALLSALSGPQGVMITLSLPPRRTAATLLGRWGAAVRLAPGLVNALRICVGAEQGGASAPAATRICPSSSAHDGPGEGPDAPSRRPFVDRMLSVPIVAVGLGEHEDGADALLSALSGVSGFRCRGRFLPAARQRRAFVAGVRRSARYGLGWTREPTGAAADRGRVSAPAGARVGPSSSAHDGPDEGPGCAVAQAFRGRKRRSSC